MSVVMAVAFIMLLSDTRLNVVDIKIKLFMAVVLLACIVSILPPVFNRIVGSAYRIIKKSKLEPEHLASLGTVLRGVFLYAIGALMSGLSLFFIAMAIYPELGFSNTIFVMGVGNLAGAVSMLAVFAPSGIGVREGIQLTLLSIIMPTELALLVTITTRIWGVVMDVAFFGIAKLLSLKDS